MTVRRVPLLCALMLALAGGPALTEDAPEARIAAAERYMAVSGFDRMIQSSIEQFAEAELEEDQRVAFRAYMGVALDRERLKDIIIEAMVGTFTTAELEALADFYGSPEGQAIFRKMPGYMRSVIPRVQQEIWATAERYRRD